MGKNTKPQQKKPSKPKADENNSGTKGTTPTGFKWSPIIIFGIFAVCAQVFSPWIYVTFFGKSVETPPVAAPKKPAAAALKADPAICPAEWANCPRVGGVDWVSLLRLQETPELADAADANTSASCDPSSLLSAQAVPGMHLFCVLPPPETGDLRVRQALPTPPLLPFPLFPFPLHLQTTKTKTVEGALLLSCSHTASLPPYLPQALFGYTDMKKGTTGRLTLIPEELRKSDDLIVALWQGLGLPPPKGGKYQPPALFTDRGVRVRTPTGALKQQR